MQKTPIKAVIFDFDDTLVATHEAIWKLHRFIAKEYYSRELTDEIMAKHWGRPIPELIENYYGTKDAEEGMRNLLAHRDEFPKTKLRFVNEIIEALSEHGICIGIVSATTRPLLEYDAKLSGIPLDKVDYIQTAEDTMFHKPDGRVFEPLLTYMDERGLSIDQVIYVGDGMQDYAAAKDAGISFIGVTTGMITNEEFLSAGANAVADMKELRDTLIKARL